MQDHSGRDSLCRSGPWPSHGGKGVLWHCIYCAVYDYVNVGIEHANLAEPQGPINGLVKTLMVYGDAATRYVNSLV